MRFASRQSEFHQFSLHSVGQRHLAVFYFYEMENTVRGVKSGRRGESATERPLLANSVGREAHLAVYSAGGKVSC